jgi:hypothetical protein
MLFTSSANINYLITEYLSLPFVFKVLLVTVYPCSIYSIFIYIQGIFFQL